MFGMSAKEKALLEQLRLDIDNQARLNRIDYVNGLVDLYARADEVLMSKFDAASKNALVELIKEQIEML